MNDNGRAIGSLGRRHDLEPQLCACGREIAGAADPAAIGIVPAEIDFPVAVIRRLWPYRGSFTWTPRPALDGRGLEDFASRIYDELRRRVGS